MSLIDTWAATGAGAFTLSENGLYTRDGWQVFLRALTPTGVFSVSRWFDPEAASETTRLLSLGVASLHGFRRDVAARPPDPRDPRAHRDAAGVADALLDAGRRDAAAASPTQHGFAVRVSPWADAADDRLARIANAASPAADSIARRAIRTSISRRPTDRRPFFFNMLKPRGFFEHRGIVERRRRQRQPPRDEDAARAGRRRWRASSWRSSSGRSSPPAGRPCRRGCSGRRFAYFAIIGLAFMLIQIAFLQRFSVYLGHPTYTFSIILFLMILSAGLGSLASERIDLERHRQICGCPLALPSPSSSRRCCCSRSSTPTVGWGLPGRTPRCRRSSSRRWRSRWAAAFRSVCGWSGRHSDRVTAWMWGVNGACGVMASILAVMVSMWLGIHVNLLAAACFMRCSQSRFAIWLPLVSARLPGAVMPSCT